MNAPATTVLPVVVIGAGPAGLVAAAHLVDRGIEPLVLEAGPAGGAAVREWAHMRLFSTAPAPRTGEVPVQGAGETAPGPGRC